MSIAGYFDGGGDWKLPVTSFAGWMATETSWKNFENEWESALEFGKVPHLRMADFSHFYPPFEHFKGKENTDHRNEFMNRIITAIERNMNIGISLTVPKAVYDATNAEYEMEERIGNAYAVAGLIALNRAAEEYDRQFFGQGLELFIESGDKGQGRLTDALKVTGFPHPVIPLNKTKDGKHIRPLEAADVLAYESFNLSRRLADIPDPLTGKTKGYVKYMPGARGLLMNLQRKSMERLLELNPLVSLMLGANMLNFCDQYKIPKRAQKEGGIS